MRPTGVLVPVLVQDPWIASAETSIRSIVHPVVVKDRAGFSPGPVCRRVAVVDLDFHSGKLGPPVPLRRKGSPYRGFGAYEVDTPSRKGVRSTVWSRSKERRHVGDLSRLESDGAFLKVSVFGTVVRTLGLVQDAAVLGREIRWAFPGKQLLVVPRAGQLDNAFYHRDSRSLQFYYAVTGEGRAVFTGLSQDIVAHEAAHAIIDGVAPSLCDAISAESLAIHEGIADITAAMLALRNRELVAKEQIESVMKEMVESSRFSRIAEEFGHWRGDGDALRDVYNTKSFRSDGDEASRVDPASPHALSQVLSGLLFEVFRAELGRSQTDRALRKRVDRANRGDLEALRLRASYAGNRVLSLAFRGLDWLPPGEASFADLLAAMLAADAAFHPGASAGVARKLVAAEAKRRGIALSVSRRPALKVGARAFHALRRDAAARARLVRACRKALGIPDDARVRVTLRPFALYSPPLVPRGGEVFELAPVFKRPVKAELRDPRNARLLVKLAWHRREPNEDPAWGKYRRYQTGATIVIDRAGKVRALLRNGQGPLQSERRHAMLARLTASDPGALTKRIGPDGLPSSRAVRASLRGDTLSIAGALQALHVAGDPP